jgi:hypothetical protein
MSWKSAIKRIKVFLVSHSFLLSRRHHQIPNSSSGQSYNFFTSFVVGLYRHHRRLNVEFFSRVYDTIRDIRTIHIHKAGLGVKRDVKERCICMNKKRRAISLKMEAAVYE